MRTYGLAIADDPKETGQVCERICMGISISKFYVTKNTNTHLWTIKVYPAMFMSFLK